MITPTVEALVRKRKIHISVRNLLRGRAWGGTYAYKYPVWCSPHAWRCAVCGGGLTVINAPLNMFSHTCRREYVSLPLGRPPRTVRRLTGLAARRRNGAGE